MRTLNALIAVATLLPTVANAGDLYFRTGETNASDQRVMAVPEGGGSPQTVFAAGTFPSGTYIGPVTRYNHPGSYGQALVVTERMNVGGDIHLYYKELAGAVHKKRVTSLDDTPQGGLVLAQAAVLGQADDFFSFLVRDTNTSRWNIWRLDVTVDEALQDGYQPPMSFLDPRLKLVLADSTGVNDPNRHTWSPDGLRVAYWDFWTASNGKAMVSVRVKDLTLGSTAPNDPILYSWEHTPSLPIMRDHLRWSPIDDRILIYGVSTSQATGAGVYTLDAAAPGPPTPVALRRAVSINKNTTRYEHDQVPIWRPDGQLLAAVHTWDTISVRGKESFSTGFQSYVSVLNPVQVVTTIDPLIAKIPIGWTP